jgi:hypothetical protein
LPKLGTVIIIASWHAGKTALAVTAAGISFVCYHWVIIAFNLFGFTKDLSNNLKQLICILVLCQIQAQVNCILNNWHCNNQPEVTWNFKSSPRDRSSQTYHWMLFVACYVFGSHPKTTSNRKKVKEIFTIFWWIDWAVNKIMMQ